jgi:hypothetical protein
MFLPLKQFPLQIWLIQSVWVGENVKIVERTCTSTKYVEVDSLEHGLRTPNEGINQRDLKNWADVADKICLGRT